MALTYDNATTMTRDGILVKNPVDTVLHDEPLLAWLLQKKFDPKPAEDNSGGYQFTVNIKYAQNPVADYNGDDLPAVGATEKFTKALFNWRFKETHSAIKHTDWLANTGADSQIIPYLSNEVKSCQEAIKQRIADGAFTAQAGLGWDSIHDIFIASTYGGIARTLTAGTREDTTVANHWWTPYREAAADADDYLKTLLHTIYWTKHFGKSKPDIAFCTQATYDKMFDMFYSKTGYMIPTAGKALDLGFSGLSFDGIPIIIDSGVDTSEVWFGNSKYMGLILHPAESFAMDKRGWHEASENSRTVSARWYATGNIISDNPGAMGIAVLT
jgi:hypothetical protein